MSATRATEDAPRTVRELVQRGREFLERKGLAHPRLDTELLVAHALGVERLRVFLELDRPVDPDEIVRAREALVRRGQGEPCAYITGTREFYGRPFAVGPGVLVPRPETELLVDVARARFGRVRFGEGSESALRVLDVGTGSGCLAVTLALELAGAEVTAVELSERALGYARENARSLGASVRFLAGDGLAPVTGESFDLVVSNPPYVDRESTELEPGVRAFEPAEALFAPAGDPDHWVRVLTGARGLLSPGGGLLIELGHDQAERLPGLVPEPWTLHRDLSGVPRVLEVEAR